MKVAPEYEKVIAATQTKEAKILAARADDIRTNALAGAQAVTLVDRAYAEQVTRQVGALAQAALFTNQIPAFQGAPSVYAERAYLETFVRATANARKYVLLTTNTHDVITFDLQESHRAKPARCDRAGAQIQVNAMRRNPLTLVIGLLLIVIFGLLLFTFQVRTTEVAVVTTFGKPTRPITEPNLYFKWPWPIQKVWTFDRRVQNFEDRLSEGLTPDGFALLTSVYVGWKVSDPTAFFPRFAGSADPIAAAEARLDQWLDTAKKAVVGKHALADFLSTSDNGAAFLGIEKEILSAIQSQIQTNNLGLQVEFLGLKRLQLPESVSQSVFDRMTSERKRLAERFQSEGETEAQTIRADAERTSGGNAGRRRIQGHPDQGNWRGRSRQVAGRFPAEPRAGQLSLPPERAGRLAQGALDSHLRPAHLPV